MKKFMLMCFATAVFSTNAFADANNVGCGWGSMVFDGKTDKGSQIMAATTNGTFGNQTFGITSGTAGCAANSTVKSYAAVSSFMAANLDKVAHDIAIGQGESLDTVASLMEMNDEHKAVFFQAAKENFQSIFPSTETTSEQALKNMSELMARHEVLAQYTI